MITALVILAVAMFGLLIGYQWGSHDGINATLDHPYVGIWDESQNRYLTAEETR